MPESLFTRLYDQKTAGKRNRHLFAWTRAMDKKKGKPSHKRFEDHSFIKRSAKFVKLDFT